VGPDNGLFSPLIEDAQRTDSEIIIVELNKPRYWLAGVSRTFHGRDVFAPAGAHLAAGISLEEMGRVITDPVLLPMPKPERIEGGWRGQVLGADRFGNLTTNLPWTQVAGRELLISIKGSIIHGLSNSYGQHQPGELVALVDSGNFLEVAVVNGSAEKLLGARVGDAVEVLFGETE